MNTTPLFLASSSAYRKQQLSQLGLTFNTHSPDINETPLSNEPSNELAQRLSIDKARQVAQNVEAGIIIGSDQTAICNGKRLSKPLTVDNAREQLSWCAGSTAYFYTGICVIDSRNNTLLSDVCCTRVVFRSLSSKQIARYVELDKPLDCAGSVKIEGLGISLFSAVTSDDPSALIGLPMITLVTMLQTLGFTLP